MLVCAITMDRRVLFLWIYLFNRDCVYVSSQLFGAGTNVFEPKESQDISTLGGSERTFPLLIPGFTKPHYPLTYYDHNLPDKLEVGEPFIVEQTCIAPGMEKGRCLPMEDCVIRRINNDYIKHKGYFCILQQQRAVGVCCPNSIKYPEHYSEGMFASASALEPVIVPSPGNSPTINSIVSVPQESDNEIQGSLDNLGNIPICGRNGKQASRIVGGTIASVKDWPWMAALLYKKDNTQFCGGAIFTRNHILTASHCVAKVTEKDIVVRLGDHDLADPNETKPEDFSVTRIIRHEDYSNITYRHDIAILVLDKPIKYNAYMQPVCLPPPGPRFTNVTAVVTGWGTISFGGPSSPVLLEVPVPVWEQQMCKKSFPQIIYDTCLCAAAYEGGKDSCQGDSGGPLTMQREDGRWAIIGVVSWGNGCAKAGSPGVYTRVNDYLDWIAENIIQ